MAKIVGLKNYNGTPFLTKHMIRTLVIAREKEMKKEPIGPIDLKGSFSALLRKDYIASKITIINGKKILSWYLTSLALEALNNLLLNP